MVRRIFWSAALQVAICLPTAGSLQAAEPSSPAQPSREKLEISPGPFQPTWESLKQYKCPDWFRDAKFGIWAHWGPQAVPMCGDWYARDMYIEGSGDYKYHVAHYGHPSKFGYKDVIALWKAEKLDPDRLMSLYKKAGARYFVSQAVHCDNFDLWDSKFHQWNAVRMGPKRNIVGDWQKAARKLGLPFGVSEHVGYSRCWFQTSHGADKTGPLAGVPYDGADPKWQDLYHPPSQPNGCEYSRDPDWHREWFVRMKDLVDQVHPDLFYTDGGVPFGVVGRSLVAHLYNVRANPSGKTEAVYTCKKHRLGRVCRRHVRTGHGARRAVRNQPRSLADRHLDRRLVLQARLEVSPRQLDRTYVGGRGEQERKPSLERCPTPRRFARSRGRTNARSTGRMDEGERRGHLWHAALEDLRRGRRSREGGAFPGGFRLLRQGHPLHHQGPNSVRHCPRLAHGREDSHPLAGQVRCRRQRDRGRRPAWRDRRVEIHAGCRGARSRAAGREALRVHVHAEDHRH